MFSDVCIRPTTHTEQHLQVPILGLEDLKLLHRSVKIVAHVVPGISRVVLFRVGVCVGEEDGAVGLVVGEGVEEVGESLCGYLLGLEVACVDVPVSVVGY